jgi:hypothetical protein
MRVISDFHDYYDSAMGFGQDASVVFKRKTTTVHAKVPGLPWNESTSNHIATNDKITVYRRAPNFSFPMEFMQIRRTNFESVELSRSMLLVGGKMLEVWCSSSGNIGGATPEAAVRSLIKTWPDRVEGEVRSIKSEMAPIQDLISAACLKELKLTKSLNTMYGAGKASKQDDHRRRVLNLQFENAAQKDWTDTHLALNAPILLMVPHFIPPFNMVLMAPPKDSNVSQQADGTSWVMPNPKDTSAIVDWATKAGVEIYARHQSGKTASIIRNPCLNRLGVAAVMDPFDCFQTLSQFIGGVAPGRSMPMVTISDKDQINKKGFDPVYGFRTRPNV